MKKSLLYLILFLIMMAVLPGNKCCAQLSPKEEINKYNFLPRETVIFEDDFSEDAVGTFPSKWRRFGKGASRSPEHCQVSEDNNDHVLVTSGIISDIEPNFEGELPDSFTFEYDFMLGADTNINVVSINLRYKQNNIVQKQNPFDVCMFVVNGNGKAQYIIPHVYNTLSDAEKQVNRYQYPGKFALNTWHHVAITSKHTACKFFIDQFYALTAPAHGTGFSGFDMHCVPPGKVKNIRIATGKQTSLFSKLITEKKFVTHIIHFDVDKSEIKPESMGYIMELAQFLSTNPSIKIEIDGHTDNDGKPSANMRLSQERADEVRKQLVLLGIDSNRLTAKGFGATRPIQLNTTPEGKNNNRRVEFIRL